MPRAPGKEGLEPQGFLMPLELRPRLDATMGQVFFIVWKAHTRMRLWYLMR